MDRSSMDQNNMDQSITAQNSTDNGMNRYGYISSQGDSRFDRPKSIDASSQPALQSGVTAQMPQSGVTAQMPQSGVTAQMPQSSVAAQMPQSGNVVAHQQAPGSSYAGFSNNINGMSAMYSSSLMNQGARMTQTGDDATNIAANTTGDSTGSTLAHSTDDSSGNGGSNDGHNHGGRSDSHRKKDKSGLGMKLLGLVAAAVVFGLVAAAVFQGVRYGTDKIINSDSKRITQQSDNSGDKSGTIKESSAEPQTESSVPQLQQTNQEPTSTVYDVATVAKEVMPSIVAITGTYVTTYEYWFDSYQQESTGAGSGIIIGKDDTYLYIATNYHVVKNAKELSVTFVDEKSTHAEVKGYAEANDIAVVTVKLSDISSSTLDEIKEIKVGSSDTLNVGDPCVAIGNALGYGQSVTVGYISALNRQVSSTDQSIKVMQTDAAINPGNSGGALVNMNGELIGINTAKYSDMSVEGMGYALPISDVQDIINDLIAGKNAVADDIQTGQTYLGISGQTITKQYSELLNMPEGVYVNSVEQGSAAEECGIMQGDIIISMDGEDISDMETLHDKIVAAEPGDKVTFVLYRVNNGGYEKQTVTAILKERQ